MASQHAGGGGLREDEQAGVNRNGEVARAYNRPTAECGEVVGGG